MVSRSDECRVKAIECIEYAMLARDPEAKRSFQDLAYSWWELAERTDRAASAHPLATLKMMNLRRPQNKGAPGCRPQGSSSQQEKRPTRIKGRTSQPSTTTPFGHTNHRPRRRFMINPVALAPAPTAGAL
jgi:hypothetical protein